MKASRTGSVGARVTRVREQFSELTGQELVSVSSVTKVDVGWQFTIEVVELHRIPDTASLLASYRVTTDDSGDVTGYERTRRYHRGEAG
jgi:hypothetical protein